MQFNHNGHIKRKLITEKVEEQYLIQNILSKPNNLFILLICSIVHL